MIPPNRLRTCITIVHSKNRDYVLALLTIHAHNNTMQEEKQKKNHKDTIMTQKRGSILEPRTVDTLVRQDKF